MFNTVEQLNTSYKVKWIEEFENASSGKLEVMWNDIFNTLKEVQKRNGIQRRGIKDVSKELLTPLNIVFSSPMGSGKTTTVQHYLNNMDTGHYKALVIVELIETCNEYEEILKDKGAVAVHSDNRRDLENNLDAPILIITHSKIISLLNRGLADEVFKEYDLVVIDEQINTFQHISFTYHEIKTKILPILDYTGIDSSVFNWMASSMEELRETKGKVNFTVPHRKYGVNGEEYETEEFLDWGTVVDEIRSYLEEHPNARDYKFLSTLGSKCTALSKQGRMKVSFFEQNKGSSIFNVVVDFLPIHISKVLFDGTATINDTYSFLNEHLGDDTVTIKAYPSVRTFKNAIVNYFPIETGKSSLTVTAHPLRDKKNYTKQLEDVTATLTKLVEDTKTRYGVEEKVLFIVHLDNVELLQPLLPENFSYTWWGKHVGSNEWKDYSKVVVFGLNYLPETVYKAIYYSTLSARTVLDTAPIDDLKTSLLSVDILQAIFRIQLRKSIDGEGNCPTGTEVLLSLPSTNKNIRDGILQRMKLILHDAEYKEIKGISRVKASSVNNTKMRELVKELETKTGGQTLYRENTLIGNDHQYLIQPKDLDIDIRRLLVRGSNVSTNLELLTQDGWMYTTPTKEEREKYTISGNVRKVFRYIGEFKDETKTDNMDVNGNDY